MAFDDAYAILNVYPDCTLQEARDAYKAAALKHHPDRHPEHRKSEAERRFKVYAEAYLQVCNDLGHEVDEQELAPPKVITGLNNTPGALALRQAARAATAAPPPATVATPRVVPPPAANHALQRRAAEEPEYYDEPAYEGEAPYPGEYDESVADEPEHYDDEPVEDYQYPVPARAPPRRQPQPPRMGSQGRQVGAYERGFSARQGGGGGYNSGGPFDDGFMDGFNQLESAFGGRNGTDMMGFDRDSFGALMRGGPGDPFEQIGQQMASMMGGMSIQDPAFGRNGGGSMQMRSRKLVMRENPDGSWSGSTQQRHMSAADGRIDMNEDGRDMYVPGRRGPPQAGRGPPGARRAGGPNSKSARPQEMWEEPPPRYQHDERFQDLPDDDADYLEGGDEYDEYDQGDYNDHDLVEAAPGPRRQDPRRIASAPGPQGHQQLARRQAQPAGPVGNPRRATGPPPALRLPPGGPGALVQTGGQDGAVVRSAGAGRPPPAGPMTKQIVPRSANAGGQGSPGGQMVRRPSNAVGPARH